MLEENQHQVMGMENANRVNVLGKIGLMGREVEPPQFQEKGTFGLPADKIMGTATDKAITAYNEQLTARQQQQMIMMQHHQQQNPFADAKYNNVNIPDAPINYGGGMADALLNDSEVPGELKKKYYYVFHKDNVLTFLDEKRKESKLLNFDITKIDMLNSMPYYDYDFDTEMEFGVMRNIFETKLDRSLGFKGSTQKNERTVLQSQFQENRQISEDGNLQSSVREGFFKRLLGRR